ncbi:MAG: hypothetical protein Q9166_002966 [cf. Caloplaca sp. 2 TL-2023]
MRSYTVIITVLLAVISNSVSAGLLRYKERPVRYGHYARSFNQSSIAAAFSSPVESTSTLSISSIQKAAQSSSSTSLFPTGLSKQVGSVPAEGSGPNAAKIDPQSLTQSPSITVVTTPQSSEPASTRSKQVGSVPAEGSGPNAAKIDPQSLTQSPSITVVKTPINTEGSLQRPSAMPSAFLGSLSTALSSTGLGTSSSQGSQFLSVSSSQQVEASSTLAASTNKPATTFATRFSLGTGVATPASQPQSSQISPTVSQGATGISSSPFSTAPQGSATAAVAFSQLTAASSGKIGSRTSIGSTVTGVTGPSLSAIPTAAGNLAMALNYNQQFKSLTPESQCNPKDLRQANACVEGLFASCNVAGRYSMSPCPEGLQCFALPLQAGSTGISVQCDAPNDASRKLQPEGTTNSSPVVLSTVTAASASLTILSNPSNSLSLATSPNQSGVQNSATVGIEPSVTQTGFQTQTTLSTAQSGTAATPDAVGTPSARQTSFQTTASFTSIQSSLTATSNTAIEPSVTQTSSQTTTISVVTEASPAPDLAPTVSQQPSASAATSSTDIPLIISFPSSLSSSLPLQSVQVSGSTKLQNPAPARAAQTLVAVPEPPVQPSPSQQPPVSVPTSAASSSSAAPPGITIVPMGNDNGNIREKVVTVTATVTTTERL